MPQHHSGVGGLGVQRESQLECRSGPVVTALSVVNHSQVSLDLGHFGSELREFLKSCGCPFHVLARHGLVGFLGVALDFVGGGCTTLARRKIGTIDTKQ